MHVHRTLLSFAWSKKYIYSSVSLWCRFLHSWPLKTEKRCKLLLVWRTSSCFTFLLWSRKAPAFPSSCNKSTNWQERKKIVFSCSHLTWSYICEILFLISCTIMKLFFFLHLRSSLNYNFLFSNYLKEQSVWRHELTNYSLTHFFVFQLFIYHEVNENSVS